MRERLNTIPHITVKRDALLSHYTRFGIGGPADLLIETAEENSFVRGLKLVRDSGLPFVVIGGGTNLIVSDAGFRGLVLRYTGRAIRSEETRVYAQSGAELQSLVDYTVECGLAGIHTMTGIPGSVGAAVYGNAGAYGHSISETASRVRFYDGESVREFSNAECEFHYRESIFKRRKCWVIFSVELELTPADAAELRRSADQIVAIRNAKYPPTMKCAGSIFKNLILSELPECVRTQVPSRVVREGKVPSAYFLEEVGAKGYSKGDIRVADYHANLIYNAGSGAASQLVEVIHELKQRVRDRFGFDLEEEVQYVGF